MLCPYMRSSSINQFKTCQMRYTFEYLFGFPGKSGKKALLGTIFHKAQELRAQGSKAIRNNKKVFADDNLGQVSVKNAFDITWALDQAFNYYDLKNKELGLEEKDKAEIRKWIDNTHEQYPQYDPKNLNIISTEQFFDFEIDKPWATYSGNLKDRSVSGKLSIKGTMDLIVQLTEDTWELVDYKSGAFRTDFATGEVKDIDYMDNDVQLLLYLIALKTLWPDKNWILTLFYIRVGGMFSVVGDDDMLERAYAMLEENFMAISDCEDPTQLDPYNRDWRCKHLCPFAKSDSFTRGQSLCQHYKQKIGRKSLQSVQDEVINEQKLFSYQDGGGRSADD